MSPHVTYLWDDSHAATLSPAQRLVYRSNILGADQRITNTGGGNTSAKLTEADPITGAPVKVLWVKGSGGDLRTSTLGNFASLYQDRLLQLQQVYAAMERRGVKTPGEDHMVGLYPHCTFNLNPRASSIDTPLHAFVPAAHVDHMHPNAVISVAASRHSERLTHEIYGDEVVWTAWQRPGFELGLTLQDVIARHPQARGIVLGQHGLINWAEDDKACYDLTLSLITRAAEYIEARDKGAQTFGGQKYAALDEATRESVLLQVLPWLRGQVSQSRRMIATLQHDATILRFVNSHDAPRLAELGTSCPDHFLRTKIKPLYVAWDPASGDVAALRTLLADGLARYRRDYAAYYEACRHPNSPAMRDPNPTVILIPGLGMIAFGKDKSESRVTAEFYNCAVEVMRGAEAIDEYVALPQQEAFDIEYWLLEEAKLQRMPAEKPLARRVVVVVGAGSGIGRAVAHRVASEGAHVVCADLSLEAAEATAAELTKKYGVGIGVAGSGISGCGPAIGVGVDVTDRASVKGLVRQALLAYGGIDHVVVTAGIFPTPDATGHVTDDMWRTTFDVNVMGGYLVADECRPVWEAQHLHGSLVLTTSVNALVAKKGSAAYDTSKAAANHLVRTLAVELAPLVRVNGLAPATVVQGSTMFPKDRVMSSLKKYGIAFDPEASADDLRTQLAQFYAQRTLTRQPITPEDQAEAAYFLLSDLTGRVTGQVINVDGGLPEAFVR
ncbi:short chain dehydrogenase [Luteitalea sp. TBR-22]|uniref:bifunctional rhamnulose-1-phosphate aldolase/short-chain dehydrogenase n=1 Tax=Luteitalea sp. TBR-22 TaxID=2802971 RepID=UPI001AF264F5|nr:bifunctional rhamnulose-1-phosphate aldolase/short-chain dehydrogenase [Luteitalea sp. TBR-22]BCS32316.1 short chain dehydrogenase [Luteitalea sp. TBR-22]